MDVEIVKLTDIIGNYEDYKTCRKCGTRNKAVEGNCWNCNDTDFIPTDFSEAEYLAEWVKVAGDLDVIVWKSEPGPIVDDWLHELENR